MSVRVWAAAGILLLSVPGVARGDVTDLDTFLQRLDEERATLTDFTATFRQARYASLFGDTKLSSGTVKYRAPHEMLWEYLEPDKSFLRLGKDDVRFYFPLLAQIEVYPLEGNRNMASLLDSFNQGAAGLRRDYELTFHPRGTARGDLDGTVVEIPEAPGIRLAPRQAALQAQFSSMDMWVRPDSFVPCLLIILEPTGDRTTFVFEEIKTNAGLDDAALDFHAPPDTEIVRVDTGA